jgi:hypothetical protein
MTVGTTRPLPGRQKVGTATENTSRCPWTQVELNHPTEGLIDFLRSLPGIRKKFADLMDCSFIIEMTVQPD